MNKKIVFVIMLISISLLCFGCKINSTGYKNFSSPENNSISNEAVLGTGALPSNIQVRGVMNDSTFYYLNNDENNTIYLYNNKDGSRTHFRKAISSNKKIHATAFSDNWVVWEEDENKSESDVNSIVDCKNWSLYAQNIHSGELLTIDEYKEIKINTSVAVSYAPEFISISDDKIVYRTFDIIDNGKVCAVIKLYDLKEKNNLIIDSLEDYFNHFYSDPKIYENNIVWSVSTLNLKLRGDENGDVFIFNLKTQEKSQLSDNNETVSPLICNNTVVARLKPNGSNDDSKIVFFGLSENKKWTTIIDSSNIIYSDKTHVELYPSSYSNNYLLWNDNIQGTFAIFNTANQKLYMIFEPKNSTQRSVPYALYGNSIFWYEVESTKEDQNNIVHKYAVLK